MTKNQSKTYKKYFKAAVATAVVTSSMVPILSPSIEASTTLKDIKSTDYYYQDIRNLQERGIISGFPDGTYRPNTYLTRGQAAKIIAGALGLDTTNVANPQFTDISSSQQYYGAIAALKEAGIVDGYEDNTFRPGDYIDRNHIAKMVSKAFKLKSSGTTTTPFTDVRSDYQDAVTSLFEYGVTTGKTATTFDGSSNVTRGQMAAFVVRAENAEETFTIINVTDAGIQTTRGNLDISSDFQEIFNVTNAVALAGAKLTAKIVGNEITAISSVQLNTSGTEGKLVTLDGGQATLNGDIIVNADFVELKNLTVTGDVTLTKKAVTEFTTDRLDIKGELIINEQSTSPVASLNNTYANNSQNLNLHLNNTAVLNVLVLRNDIIVNANTKLPGLTISANVASIQINADTGEVIIDVNVKLEISGTGSIDQLTISQVAEIALKIAGQIRELVIAQIGTKVEVGLNVFIENLTVPGGSSPSSIIINYDNIQNNIPNIKGNDGSIIKSGNTGGSTGGGYVIPTYPITFTGFDDATVIVKDILNNVVTDLTKVKNGTYSYTITKTGFATVTGTITVSGAAVTKAITLFTPQEAALLKIDAYAESNGNPAPTVADYTTAGITGVIEGNLTLVNAAIDAKAKGEVDSVAEIQTIVNPAIALAKIDTYAENNGNPAPTVADYTTAGIIGVTEGNLTLVNTAIDAKTKGEVDSVAEIQAVVNLAITTAKIEADLATLTEGAIKGTNTDLAHVQANLTSLTTGYLATGLVNTSAITWSSTTVNGATIAADGTVTRSNADNEHDLVVLTASATLDGVTKTKDFNIIILESHKSSSNIVEQIVKSNVTVSVTSEELGVAYLVPSNTVLATIDTQAKLDALVNDATVTKVVITAANENTLIEVPNTEGAYMLIFVDKAGNVSTPSTNFVTVDDTQPTATTVPTSLQASDGFYNANEVSNGVAIVAGLGTSGAVAGDTLQILVGDVVKDLRVLTAAEMTAGSFTFTLDAADLGTDGSKSITTRVIDKAGNVGATSSALTVWKDTTASTINSVLASIPDGSYKVGTHIPITVQFNEPVIVMGISKLTLSDGIADIFNRPMPPIPTITFDYIVGPIDNSADLNVTAITLLTGDTIKDAAGNDANLTIVPNILSSTRNIVIDTIAPTEPIFTTATKKGGVNITITAPSTEETAWFAPASTSVFAEGTTMTKSTTDTIATPTADGIYRLFFVDEAGNVSTPSRGELTVDSTPPNTPIIQTGVQTINADSIIITGTAEANSTITITGGAEQVAVQANGSGVYSVLVKLTQNAMNTLSVTATDQIGNVSSTATVAITEDSIDPTAPTAVTITPIGGTVVANTVNTTNTSLQFTATIIAGDGTGGKAQFYVGDTKVGEDTEIANTDASVTIDTSDGTPTNAELQAEISAGGEVTVKLFDAAGNNVTSVTDNPTLVIDYSVPTASVQTTAVNTTVTSTVNVQSSEIGTAYLVLDSANITTAAEAIAAVGSGTAKNVAIANVNTDTAIMMTGLVDGDYKVVAVDVAGNISAESVGTVTIDNMPPIVSGVANQSFYNASVTPTFEAGATATLSKDVGTANTFVSGAVINGDGSYQLVVTDRVGNSTVVNFEIDTVKPMVVAIKLRDGGNNTPVSYLSNVNDTVQITFSEPMDTLRQSSITVDSIEQLFNIQVYDTNQNFTSQRVEIQYASPTVLLLTIKEVPNLIGATKGVYEGDTITIGNIGAATNILVDRAGNNLSGIQNGTVRVGTF